MRDNKGDSQYLVFALGADTPSCCTNDFGEARLYAIENAQEENETFEVYSKIGQAIPPPPSAPIYREVHDKKLRSRSA